MRTDTGAGTELNRRSIIKLTSQPFMQGIMYVFIILICMLALLPIVYAVFASVKPLDQLMADGARLLPRIWRFENYSEVWVLGNFSRYFLNSIIVAVSVVTIDVLFSSMFGYVLARKQIAGLRMIEATFAATIFLGVGTVTLYPQFLIAKQFGLLGIPGIVLVQLGGMMVVHIFLIKSFCEGLSREMDEAAKMDGCGFFSIYWRIVFPLLRPILSTVAILGFQASWNNFQVPFVFTMSLPEFRTLIIGVYALKSSGEAAGAWNLMLAGTMLSLLPIILLFLFMQKYFMKGLTEGSIKG
ncbi:carbohydrate ABC transporter permease [Paenibacillus sp. strain BS8-2]